MDILDVIYTPLDVPPVVTNIDDVYKWTAEVYPQIDREVCTPSFYAENELQKDYPWNITFAKFKGKWYPGFKERFPEIANYCSAAFGLEEEEVVTAIILPTKDKYIGPGFWHADPDCTGLRFYITNENYEKNPIEFKRTKVPYQTRPNWFSAVADPFIDSPLFEKEIQVAYAAHENQAFFLNNVRAVHRIQVNVPGRRCAVLVFPDKHTRHDLMDRLGELVVRSAKKFKEHSIIWQP